MQITIHDVKTIKAQHHCATLSNRELAHWVDVTLPGSDAPDINITLHFDVGAKARAFADAINSAMPATAQQEAA